LYATNEANATKKTNANYFGQHSGSGSPGRNEFPHRDTAFHADHRGRGLCRTYLDCAEKKAGNERMCGVRRQRLGFVFRIADDKAKSLRQPGNNKSFLSFRNLEGQAELQFSLTPFGIIGNPSLFLGSPGIQAGRDSDKSVWRRWQWRLLTIAVPRFTKAIGKMFHCEYLDLL
jgi:hypothetical protein